MTSAQNVESFNHMTGCIFAKLYSFFPVPITLTAFNCGVISIEPWKIAEERSKERNSLIQEGRTELTRSGKFLDVVETLKNLNPGAPSDLVEQTRFDLQFFPIPCNGSVTRDL